MWEDSINSMQDFIKESFKTDVKITKTRQQWRYSNQKRWKFEAEYNGQEYEIGNCDNLDGLNIYENIPIELFKNKVIYDQYRRSFDEKED